MGGEGERSEWRQTSEEGRAGLMLPVPGQTSKPGSPFFSCGPASGHCGGPEAQMRVRLRGTAGILMAGEVPGFLPVSPTLPSLEKSISMPRSQGRCRLSMEGLLLRRLPGCPSLLPRSQDPTSH